MYIYITFEIDFFYIGLSNFVIGVTTDSPSLMTPDVTPGNYPVCETFIPSQSTTAHTYPCSPAPISGQYVIIQSLEMTSTTLELCEVMVLEALGNNSCSKINYILYK